jgi:hypothetical protein
MHHDVAAPVARLLAGVRVGRPWREPSGLTVVPLEAAGGRGLRTASEEGPELQVMETVPPRAGELLVLNRGSRPLTLHTGDLFTGGLADRAAHRAIVVDPRVERLVPVEPVDVRWWWTGPPVLGGTLDPAESALVALAGLDGSAPAGLAAIARTSLWAVARRPVLEADLRSRPSAGVATARGWVLLADAAVLAAQVWADSRALGVGEEPVHRPRHDERAAARRFLSVLGAARWTATAAGTATGRLAGHHVGGALHGGRMVELGSVLLSTALADALRASR